MAHHSWDSGVARRRERSLTKRALGLFVVLTPVVAHADPPHTEKRQEDRVTYVCPPCGCKADSSTFERPGKCPTCGMGLVRKGPPHPARYVAIIIFDGMNFMDLAGPAEVFSTARGSDPRTFEVFTVATNKDSVESRDAVVTLIPEYTLDKCPKPDVIVVPGGRIRELTNDPQITDWLRERSNDCEVIVAAPDAVAVLAKVGLLNGRDVTTIKWNITRLQKDYPDIRVLENRRYVDGGKVITTASVSAEIDAALAVVERFYGVEAAQNTAAELDYRRRAALPEDARNAASDTGDGTGR